MLVPSAASLFATTFFFSTAAVAAPTRTHCRCTIVTDAAPAAIVTPSVAHWTPTESSSNPLAGDVCSNLGPELENFQHTKPDLYASYVSRPEGFSANGDLQRPLTGDMFVKFAAADGLRSRGGSNNEPRPTARPHQRIVCRSEADPFTAYQGSFVTLWALQMVVAIAILACIAEGVHLSLRWYGTTDSASHSMMRLPGSRNLVLRFSSSGIEVRDAEKEDGTEQETPMLVVQAPNGDRVRITYEEDDDDEMNRPVM
jgi:hypothetical protein